MAFLLLKTEPSTYSYADLKRDKRTAWDGVKNALAQQHLRAAKQGDLVAVYHTGGEKQVVGIAELTSDPYPDPTAGDPKGVAVDLRPRKRLAAPVPLEVLKAAAAFADSPLLTQGRLSVVPLTDAQWKALLALGRTTL